MRNVWKSQKPWRYFGASRQALTLLTGFTLFHCALGYAIGQCIASSATTLNVEVASFETPEMMGCFGMNHAILQLLLVCLSSTYLVTFQPSSQRTLLLLQLSKNQPITSLGKSNPIGIPFNVPSTLCLGQTFDPAIMKTLWLASAGFISLRLRGARKLTACLYLL